VQTNFGGVLSIDGAPVGVELGKYFLKDAVSKNSINKNDLNDNADGSIIIVIATDAPLDARQLKRLAARSMSGLARTGSAMTNGSGDYAIAFSAVPEIRIRSGENLRSVKILSNDAMSPLFLAVIEATEEAIYNSMFRAETMKGKQGRTIEALPIDETVKILRKYGKIK
jgi:D-aminopeptidase